MENIESQVAKYLLDIKAVELQPEKPFTWASGWKSPIYTDNRKTLSYPEARNFLKQCFADIIRRDYPDVEVIAGVATGAIAIGALVADLLGLPFVYVRSASKGHGLENQVEGVCHAGQKVVVIVGIGYFGIGYAAAYINSSAFGTYCGFEGNAGLNDFAVILSGFGIRIRYMFHFMSHNSC